MDTNFVSFGSNYFLYISYNFKKYNISYIYGIAKVLKSQDEIDKIRLHGNFVLCSVL